MMRVTGVITEYNPFHLGHKYQLDTIRKLNGDNSYIIAVMSGSFTQRGEVSILDKWSRATSAVRNGCDLVLELPFVFSSRSAQDFARGGIRLLGSLGIVDMLAFGTESDNLNLLKLASQALDDELVEISLKDNLSKGMSYALSIANTISTSLNIRTDLFTSNNILAIEYLRAIKFFAPKIRPLPIKRLGANHNEMTLFSKLSSATAIRQEVYTNNTDWDLLRQNLPSDILDELKLQKSVGLPNHSKILLLLKYKLMSSELSDIRLCQGISEGLEYSFANNINNSSLNNFIKGVSSKRYPYTRIARIIPLMLLNVTKDYIRKIDALGPLYIRPIAFNDRGKNLLKEIKANSTLPIITKVSHTIKNQAIKSSNRKLTSVAQMLAIDTLATDLRNLLIDTLNNKSDFTMSPIYIH